MFSGGLRVRCPEVAKGGRALEVVASGASLSKGLKMSEARWPRVFGGGLRVRHMEVAEGGHAPKVVAGRASLLKGPKMSEARWPRVFDRRTFDLSNAVAYMLILITF